MAHRRLVAACVALAIAALPLTLTGCVSTPQCLPQPLITTPSSVAAGSTVTVSSKAASCDLGYPSGHTYTLQLGQGGVMTKAVDAPVKKDGSFAARLDVPSDFARGTAYIVVKGSTYDDCKDTGSGSCAGYTTKVTVK
jgi:hypothetical protein